MKELGTNYMKELKYANLEGRTALIEKLVEDYMNSSASEVSVILGNHGSGKTYVIYETINEILKRNKLRNKIQVFVPQDDELATYVSSKCLSVENIEANISLPLRFGIGFDISAAISKNNTKSQFNYISSLLRKNFSSDILICVPKYLKQDRKIRILIKLIIDNLQQLKKSFKHKIFFLISDVDKLCINDFISCTSINEYFLEDYEEDDILQYLINKHGIVTNKTELLDKIKQIKKICASNLKLVDFLYVDFVEQDISFFRALDSVVTYRLTQLKDDGLKGNISEDDMEDIILTSSLSIKSFGSDEIALVSDKPSNLVRKSLQLAENQVLLKSNSLHFYNFTCEEIQEILRKKLFCKNKERYLDYYNYYCVNEEDQYYFRAYYLWAYDNCMKDEIFALLILAYSNALKLIDLQCIQKIDSFFDTDKCSLKFSKDYRQIKTFYTMVNSDSTNFDDLKSFYDNLQRDYYELPLKAELARAFFHFMYKHLLPWDMTLKHTLSQLLQYANEKISLSLSPYPVKINPIDESVLRLRIIYDIAPFILDSLNDIELFRNLYNLISELSHRIQISSSGRSIAKYMENVFNRKAFLFVNQMQCGIFYDKAKKYFIDNNIWDEYCITLICEAGTDIVIQKYEEAMKCCYKAKRIALEKGIVIPLPQKLANNAIISNFLLYESKHSEKECLKYAQKTCKKLRKFLCRVPCATEFVIVTNICSLYIYSGDIAEYSEYKKYLEHLMECENVANLKDDDIDDFYRYYFAWFEIYKCILESKWNEANAIADNLQGFVPSLFKKQEVFWDKKLLALNKLLENKSFVNGYNFCKNLVPLNRRASELAVFFCRGLMLSDLQYTSYD